MFSGLNIFDEQRLWNCVPGGTRVISTRVDLKLGNRQQPYLAARQ
jgi:hypothetical protein